MAIKVLHIFGPKYTKRFSGHVAYWQFIFNRWAAREVTHYVYHDKSGKILPASAAFEFDFSNNITHISRLEKLLWTFRLFNVLFTQIKDFDILDMHTLGWGGLFIGPWSKNTKIPSIYECALLGADTPSGIRKESFGKFKVWCLKQYSKIIAISKYLAEDYLSNGFSRNQVVKLLHCVDTDTITPVRSHQHKTLLRKKHGLPTDTEILLFIGAVNQRKGVDTLLHGFNQVVQVNKDTYLLVVGPNTKHVEFMDELIKYLGQENLSEKVYFWGIEPNKEVITELYQCANMFVFPSNREGLPNVILEAMAAGLPIVVSQLPVLEEVIQHKYNGLFIPVGDKEALAQSILSLSEDPSLAEQLGQNARQFVEDNLSYAAWEKKLVALYQSLIP